MISKKTLFICAAALFTMVIISLAGNIIIIGDKIAAVHPYLGYGFYIVLGLFVLRFVVWPTLRFLFTPELKGDERHRLPEMTEQELTKYIKGLGLNATERALLTSAPSEREGVEQVLTLRDAEANQVVRRAAINVFVVTGISQNGSFDIITAFGMNVQMINSLVSLRGRRPSLTQLVELYVVVISSTLLISLADDLLDEIDTGQILGSAAGGLAKTLVSSAVNGAMNAYLTLRIGKMTMKYLEMGSSYFKQNRRAIRKQVRSSALKEVPAIAKSGLETISSSIKSSAAEKFGSAAEKISNAAGKLSNLNPLKRE